MNFDVFESLLGSGSVGILSVVGVGSFIAVVLFRVGSSIQNQFVLLQSENLSMNDFVKSLLIMFVFIIFVIAFVQFIS